MSLMLKVIAVALVHVAFFACYPETGKMGDYYLWISLLVWTVFMLFLNTSTAILRFISGAFGAALNLAAFALMTLAIAATMPQHDRVSVLEKLQKGRYPDRDTINSGMLRFGVNLNREVKGGSRKLDREVDKALHKLKETE